MTLTGETDHVGKPNESIMSVRFMGDKGYVVTYLRKDPFYVYDLSSCSGSDYGLATFGMLPDQSERLSLISSTLRLGGKCACVLGG